MTRGTEERREAYVHGHKGEALAAFYLRAKGYRILARRYKTPVGEADLIARKKRTIAFIEVKARADFRDGVEAVKRHQQKRIIRAAQYFITERPALADLDLRFDAVVVLPGLGVRHLENAWQA